MGRMNTRANGFNLGNCLVYYFHTMSNAFNYWSRARSGIVEYIYTRQEVGTNHEGNEVCILDGIASPKFGGWIA